MQPSPTLCNLRECVWWFACVLAQHMSWEGQQRTSNGLDARCCRLELGEKADAGCEFMLPARRLRSQRRVLVWCVAGGGRVAIELAGGGASARGHRPLESQEKASTKSKAAATQQHMRRRLERRHREAELAHQLLHLDGIDGTALVLRRSNSISREAGSGSKHDAPQCEAMWKDRTPANKKDKSPPLPGRIEKTGERRKARAHAEKGAPASAGAARPLGPTITAPLSCLQENLLTTLLEAAPFGPCAAHRCVPRTPASLRLLPAIGPAGHGGRVGGPTVDLHTQGKPDVSPNRWPPGPARSLWSCKPPQRRKPPVILCHGCLQPYSRRLVLSVQHMACVARRARADPGPHKASHDARRTMSSCHSPSHRRRHIVDVHRANTGPRMRASTRPANTDKQLAATRRLRSHASRCVSTMRRTQWSGGRPTIWGRQAQTLRIWRALHGPPQRCHSCHARYMRRPPAAQIQLERRSSDAPAHIRLIVVLRWR